MGELIDFHLDILGLNLGSPKSGCRGSIPPRLAASVAHHLGVDGAADAVGQLGVQLGQLVAAVHARLGLEIAPKVREDCTIMEKGTMAIS